MVIMTNPMLKQISLCKYNGSSGNFAVMFSTNIFSGDKLFLFKKQINLNDRYSLCCHVPYARQRVSWVMKAGLLYFVTRARKLTLNLRLECKFCPLHDPSECKICPSHQRGECKICSWHDPSECNFHPLHNPSGCIIPQEPFVKGSGELLNSMS